MAKHGSIALLFLLHGFLVNGQPVTGKMEWIIPLNEKQLPIGKPASNQFAIRESGQIFLLHLNGEKQFIDGDSISHEQGSFWKIWKNGLVGIYHLEKGELIPPVYERIKPVAKSADNWAFEVNKYGMRAVVNDDNQLIVPYSRMLFRNLKIIGDTILEYQVRETFHFSINGHPVSNKVARLQKGPGFQRISKNQYAFSSLVGGQEIRDTFLEAKSFVRGVAQVRGEDGWGYLLPNGKWMIRPRYQAAFDFNEMGHAVVKQNDKYGLIHRDGSFLIKPTFEFLKPFTNGLYEYKENGLLGLVDSLGKTIVAPDKYGSFSEIGTDCVYAKSGDTLLIFQKNGTALPVNGIRSVTLKPADVSNFIAGKLYPTKGMPYRQKRGLLSPSGKWIIEPVLSHSIGSSKYFIAPKADADPCCRIGRVEFDASQKDKFLLFDRLGNPLLPMPVENIMLSEGPFATYLDGEKYGLVSISDFQLAAEYDKLEMVGQGWVYVKKGGQFGVLKWKE